MVAWLEEDHSCPQSLPLPSASPLLVSSSPPPGLSSMRPSLTQAQSYGTKGHGQRPLNS